MTRKPRKYRPIGVGGFIVLFFAALAFLPFSTARAQHVSTVSTGVTTTGTYSDNTSVTTEDKQSGFYWDLNPWVRYDFQARNTNLGLMYSPSFRYYFDDRDHFLSHSLNLNADHQLRKNLSTSFSNSLRISQDPYDIPELVFERIEDDIIIIEDPTLRTGRSTYYSNNLRQSFRYRFGPSDHVTLGYSFGFLKNDSPDYEDSLNHGPNLGVTYWWTADYGTVFSASYRRGEFDESPSINTYSANLRLIRKVTPLLSVFVSHGQSYVRYDRERGLEDAAPNRDYEVFNVNVGVDYDLTPTTFLTLSAGVFYKQEQGGDSTTGSQLDADLARQFRRGSVRLSGGTGYDDAFFGAENLGFAQYYRASVLGSYTFTRRCSGNLAFQYRRNNYEQVDREDDTYTFSSGLSYVFRPWLTGSVSYVHRMVESSIPNNDYTENRVSVTLTATPTIPFRLN